MICWIRSIGRGFNLKSILGRMRLGAILYWLWRERNNRVFSKVTNEKERILLVIERAVKDRAMELTNMVNTHENTHLDIKWGLPYFIFKDQRRER